MTDNDGAPPVDGVETAPDGSHLVNDQFEPPPVETRPLEIQPDYHTQPDEDVRPEYHTQPDAEIIADEPIPPHDFPIASREELEMALHRAQLVMDDCTTLLDPALQAMQDGAWVSRRGDEFSTALTTHSRLAGTVAESCVETIQVAIDGYTNPELPEVRPL